MFRVRLLYLSRCRWHNCSTNLLFNSISFFGLSRVLEVEPWWVWLIVMVETWVGNVELDWPCVLGGDGVSGVGTTWWNWLCYGWSPSFFLSWGNYRTLKSRVWGGSGCNVILRRLRGVIQGTRVGFSSLSLSLSSPLLVKSMSSGVKNKGEGVRDNCLLLFSNEVALGEE